MTEDGETFTPKQSLELLRALIQRELKARYRGSHLGWAWALVRPLVMLFVYGLVVGVFLGAARSIPDFMIFIFVGLLAWNLFSSIVVGSINSVSASGALLSKHRFPVLLVPVASVVVAVIDAAIMGSVLLVAYALVGDWPSLPALAYLVPSVVCIILFGLGLGLVLSALNVFARDVGFLTEVALQVGFWLCPILYSYAFVTKAAEAYGWSVEWVTRVYMLNPMANAVLGFQRALWPPAGTPEGVDMAFPGQLGARLMILMAVLSVVLGLGILLFQRLSRDFAQEF